MNEYVDELKKLAEEEFINNTMKHLDSGLIFTYIKNLEDRIDKAIEYIHNNYPVCAGKELLDILQGSDKE